VFTSHDESVYKSLLPVYFPPSDILASNAQSSRSTNVPISSESSGQPRRTLFKIREFRDKKQEEVEEWGESDQKESDQELSPTLGPIENMDVMSSDLEGMDTIEHYYTYIDPLTSDTNYPPNSNLLTTPSSADPSQSQPPSSLPEHRWTKLYRRFVDPQALEESNEEFEESDDILFVKRKMSRREIKLLVERTREIRKGKGRWVRGRKRAGVEAYI
jgi:hypothetical protein